MSAKLIAVATILVLVVGGVLLWLHMRTTKPASPSGQLVDRRSADVGTSAPARAHGNAGKGAQPEQDVVAPVREDFLADMERQILKGEQAMQLEAVRAYDLEIAAKHDLPDDVIATAKSSVLCGHFAASPMRVWFGLYDDRNMGIARAIRASRTLKELVQRADIVDGICNCMAQAIHLAAEEKARNLGEISMVLMISQELLMYPPVLEKTAGRERQILRALCEQYRRMTEINRAAGEDAPFSASLDSTKRLAILLLDRLEPGKWQMPGQNQEAAWFQSIQTVLG